MTAIPHNEISGYRYTPSSDYSGNAGSGELDLADLVEKIRAGRKQIMASCLVFAFFTLLYVLFASPIYQSRALVRIESDGEMILSGVSTEGEMQVIKSRSVIGEAVERLGWTISVQKKDSGFISSLFAESSAEAVNNPEIGLEAASGLVIEELSVPKTMLETKLRVVAAGEGGFELFDANNRKILVGDVGRSVEGKVAGSDEKIRVKIKSISSRKGEEFSVIKLYKEKMIDVLQESINVDQRGIKGRGGPIDVTFVHPDRETARSFLNVLLEVYEETAFDRESRGVMQVLTHLEDQLPELQQNLGDAEAALEEFRIMEGTVDISKESVTLVQQVSDLEQNIWEAKKEQEKLKTSYTNRHPSMIAVNNQLAYYQNELANLDERIQKMPENQRQLANLMRAVEIYNRMYAYNVSKINTLRIKAAGITGYARVVDEPEVSYDPIWPKSGLLLLGNALLGALIGFVFVVVKSSPLLSKAENAHDMKGHLDVPVLATLPYSPAQATLEDRLGKASRSNSLLLLHNPSSETSDGIRSLADKVPFLVAMASNNILLISSPGEAQGRTFTAANFAAACSLTRKVLLVDCNLSHPEIHNYFAVENVPGLSEAIIEPSGIKMAVKNAPDIPNLKIISAGTLPPNENNLLRHENFAKIITEQAAKFDLVVVDFPALNPRLITPQSIGFAGMVVMVSDGTNISRLRRVVEYYRGFGSIVGGIIINKPAVREKSLFSVLLGRG